MDGNRRWISFEGRRRKLVFVGYLRRSRRRRGGGRRGNRRARILSSFSLRSTFLLRPPKDPTRLSLTFTIPFPSPLPLTLFKMPSSPFHGPLLLRPSPLPSLLLLLSSRRAHNVRKRNRTSLPQRLRSSPRFGKHQTGSKALLESRGVEVLVEECGERVGRRASFERDDSRRWVGFRCG